VECGVRRKTSALPRRAEPSPGAVGYRPGVPGDRESSAGAGLDRRTVVGGFLSTVLLAATAGCSGSGSNAGSAASAGEPGSKNSSNPDSGLLVAVRSAELGLIAQYDALLPQFPALSARLGAMRADHAGHLAAVGGALPEATPTPTASPGAPLDQSQAMAMLAGAERSAASALIGECGSAHDQQLARLIAAIGGCEAAHASLLDELAIQKPPTPTKSPRPSKHRQETE
jgi:hypothetical protein